METRILYILAIVLSTLLVTQGAKRRIQVEFTNINVDIRLPHLIVFNAWINRTSSNISAIYLNCKLSKDVYNITGPLNLKMKHTDKFVDYFTNELDYCKGLQTIYSQHVMRMIASGIRSVSNYPLDCPLKKNFEYYIKGFTADTKLIPSYFPNMSFVLNMTFHTNLRPGIILTVSGEIRRK